MASFIYNEFKADLMGGAVDLDTSGDTIRVALMGTGHSASAAANVNWTSVSANELANGSGYTTGGATLAGQAVTEAATTAWDGTDTAWTSATFSAYYAVIYDTTNTNSLIASIDFGGVQTVSSGTFTIQWHSNGIITLA